jgi:hypothetical protein
MSISLREQRTDPGRRRALRCVACLSVAAFPVTAIAQQATA